MADLSSSDVEMVSDGSTYGDPGQEVSEAGSAIVAALATVLTHLASIAPGRPGKLTHFHCVRAPALSIHDYLMRISQYFQCSNECFVLSLVYIDRIVKLHPEFQVSSLNIHRLIVTSVMLAVKFFDDVYYSNAYYAKVGGIKTKEVNGLESQFLRLIDWRVQVTPQEYDQYRNHVYTAIQGNSISSGLPPPRALPASSFGDASMDNTNGSGHASGRYSTNCRASPYPSEDVKMSSD